MAGLTAPSVIHLRQPFSHTRMSGFFLSHTRMSGLRWTRQLLNAYSLRARGSARTGMLTSKETGELIGRALALSLAGL